MIRYHSVSVSFHFVYFTCYLYALDIYILSISQAYLAWHDKGANRHLMKPHDHDRIKWLQLFNKFDLYTKDGNNELRGETMKDQLWHYYLELLEKYGLGGKLKR